MRRIADIVFAAGRGKTEVSRRTSNDMMQIKIPFLNTSVETDLLVTFLLIPLWWVTGFSAFIFVLVPLLVFFKMAMKRDSLLQIPYAAVCFFVFMMFYLASILINIGLRPAPRILASFNNLSLILMGFCIMVGVYNCDADVFFKRFVRYSRILCIITSVIGAVFLALWYSGVREIEIPTLLAVKMPGLLKLPYFYNFLRISNSLPLYSLSEPPRLTIYSMVPTATGGLMLVLMPMMMAYYRLTPQKSWQFPLFFSLAMIVLIFSVCRAAIYGFAFAWIFLYVYERGFITRTAFIYAFLGLIASGYLMKGIEWVLSIRTSSNVGRFQLYEQAFKILLNENPLMGVGVRLRDDFTMMAIGSHSLYMEILFVSGFINFPIFILFQYMVLKKWFDQRNQLKTEMNKILWRYLGMSLISLNIWAITDTLLGLPFTAYSYYLIAGGVLLLGKSL